jgi:hypothetical protein
VRFDFVVRAEALAQIAREELAHRLVVLDDDQQRLLWRRAPAHLPEQS